MTFCEKPDYSHSNGENCAETKEEAFEDVVVASEDADRLYGAEKIAEERTPRIIGIIPDLSAPSNRATIKLTSTKKILKQTTLLTVAFSLGVTTAFLWKGNSPRDGQATPKLKNAVAVEESNKVANLEAEKTDAPSVASFSPYDNAYEPEVTTPALSQMEESGSYADYDRIDFSAPAPADFFDSSDLDAWAALGDMLQSTESNAYDAGSSYDNSPRITQNDAATSYQSGVGGGFADYSFGSNTPATNFEGGSDRASIPTAGYQDERLASNRLANSQVEPSYSLNTNYSNNNDNTRIGFSENNANYGDFSRKGNYNEDFNRDDSREIASRRNLDLEYATNSDQGRSRFQGFETRSSTLAQNDPSFAERQPSAYVAQRVEEEAKLPLQGSASSRSVRW